jgi:hypothetical protein
MAQRRRRHAGSFSAWGGARCGNLQVGLGAVCWQFAGKVEGVLHEAGEFYLRMGSDDQKWDWLV